VRIISRSLTSIHEVICGVRFPEAYIRSHTNLVPGNFGFICAFFLFFVALTAIGMELQKPNKGGGAVTIYKRGQVPKTVEKAMEVQAQPGDIENGKSEAVANGAEKNGSNDSLEGVAKNETVCK